MRMTSKNVSDALSDQFGYVISKAPGGWRVHDDGQTGYEAFCKTLSDVVSRYNIAPWCRPDDDGSC
jgi:hypothetical protein